jgi:hypothetical protein
MQLLHRIVVQEHACLMLSDRVYQGLVQRVFCVKDDNDSKPTTATTMTTEMTKTTTTTTTTTTATTTTMTETVLHKKAEQPPFENAKTSHRLDTGLPRPV